MTDDKLTFWRKINWGKELTVVVKAISVIGFWLFGENFNTDLCLTTIKRSEREGNKSLWKKTKVGIIILNQF